MYTCRCINPKFAHLPLAEVFGTDASAGSGINFDQYDSITVVRSGPNANDVPSLESFEELHSSLPSFLSGNLTRMRHRKPTPIQKHAIPLIMAGRDVLCAAQTGSGKTLAFLLPTIASIHGSRSASTGGGVRTPARPRALVLAPTRELVITIHNIENVFLAMVVMDCLNLS